MKQQKKDSIIMSTFVKDLKTDSGLHMRFTSPSESIFHIQVSHYNHYEESGLSRYGIIKNEYSSHQVEVNDQAGSTSICSAKASLHINHDHGTVSLQNLNKTVINQVSNIIQSPEGFSLQINLQPEEKLYGLGDESRDKIQKRGHKNKLIVRNVVSYAPSTFLMSSAGWGVFVNTTVFHTVDAGASNPDILEFNSKLGHLDYYLFTGASLKELLDIYTQLTGRPIMLPQWAYGLSFVCDEREVRARDVLNDAYSFRREGIPCDMLSLEPSWMETRYDFSTEKKWSEERFHTPFWLKPQSQGTFAGALKNMGFKLGLWLCCDYDLSEYEESLLDDGVNQTDYMAEVTEVGTSEHDLIKDSHFRPTMMDRITKNGEPWFEHLKKFVDDGARAFKLDGANQVNFHPDRKWRNGMDDKEMHNLYPVLLAKQMAHGFMDYTKLRSMIFTSGGYSGIQQYAATWAGDTGGEAGPLTSMLNHGLSGHSNTAADMSVATVEGIHFGFMQPWTQAFSWHQYNQPWFLGEERQASFKFYAQLRYRLLPYIYSMAHHANRTGTPIIRAMPLEFPNDPKSDDLILQYMFGQSLLTGSFTKTIYLPAGFWTNYWTGQKVEGGTEIPVDVTSPQGGPLFVKQGSIIPMWQEMSYVGHKNTNTIYLNLYPGENTNFTLYEDDGETLDYLSGSVAETKMELNSSSNKITLSISSRIGRYNGMPEIRNYHCIFHCSSPKRVIVNNTENSTWSYDDQKQQLSLLIPDTAQKEATVSIED